MWPSKAKTGEMAPTRPPKMLRMPATIQPAPSEKPSLVSTLLALRKQGTSIKRKMAATIARTTAMQLQRARILSEILTFNKGSKVVQTKVRKTKISKTKATMADQVALI